MSQSIAQALIAALAKKRSEPRITLPGKQPNSRDIRRYQERQQRRTNHARR